MKLHICRSIGAALLALPLTSQAQPSAHYVPGVEGIKGASLPPPGIYLRDYNVAYYSEQLNDSSGNSIGALNTRAFIYAQVPRVIWITPLAGARRQHRRGRPGAAPIHQPQSRRL